MKDIEGYDGKYAISRDGRVYSRKTNTYLKLKESNGYLRVALYHNGGYKVHRVHRLVAKAYLPTVNTSKEVNHKDKDRKNNHVSNLEWCTRQENENHKKSFDRHEHLNSVVLKLVKLLLENGVSSTSIVDASGLPASTVLSIKHSSLFKNPTD